MSTQFTSGPTRNIQAGDTPDLNDGLLSRKITGPQSSSKTINRGVACYLVAGEVTTGTQTLSLAGHSPFVPIASVTATGTSAAAVEEPIDGVVAPQRVAVTIRGDTGDGTVFNPGDYLKLSEDTTGQLHKWNDGDADASKYARFLGIEAALLDRDSSTTFDETLTSGIRPDQQVTVADGVTFVGWAQLMENSAI